MAPEQACNVIFRYAVTWDGHGDAIVIPSLDFIRGFEAAARHLSFTRAADELCLTQSAISRQIKSLEEQLQVQLFRRSANQLTLTPEGQTLLRAARSALAEIDDAANAIRREKANRVLTLTTTTSFASLWLLPRMADFLGAFPGVDLRISTNNAVLDLDREGIDLAIRTQAGTCSPAGTLHLISENIYPVCSPALPGGRPLPTRHEDMRTQVLIHFDERPKLRTGLDWGKWFTDAGLGSVRSSGAIHLTYYEQVVQAAIAGQGIALGRHALIRDFIEARQLVAPFGTAGEPTRVYYLAMSRAARAEPITRHFIDWLTDRIGAAAWHAS